MKKVEWQVDGMTCSNCALSVTKYLQQQGMQAVKVDPLSGQVSFELITNEDPSEKLMKGISQLGYSVRNDRESKKPTRFSLLGSNKKRFLFTLPFTALLMSHMLPNSMHLHFLMNPWNQLLLCLPVFLTGMFFFGRSAWKSIRSGIPNMNVLVAMGGLVSFAYSIVGLLFFDTSYALYFETSASIFTLVFLGNYLEESTMRSTQRALSKLTQAQQVMANMIAFDDKYQEQIFQVENTALKTGDLILIKTGEQVPADCKILWGDCRVNESILTGESLPKSKTKKEVLIGGSILQDGMVKAQVTAAGNDTVLSGIIQMVKKAQAEKPPMQQLADKISAVFVPVVLIISLLSLFINVILLHTSWVDAIMRSVAVLVISCPCAMGLATPAAISVGLGRGARKGILYRNASVLEAFSKIRQVVFDKTGTLTTGSFHINHFHSEIETSLFKSIVASLEKFSNHPIAVCISAEWKDATPIRWEKTEEVKGRGMTGISMEGDVFEIGSAGLYDHHTYDRNHNVYVYKNQKPVGWIDVSDNIRPEAESVIQWLRKQEIKVVMLTGDLQEKAMEVAQQLGIEEIYAEQSPADKLEKITSLSLATPTAMVGDGVNDAPALAKATVGIAMGDAAQLSIMHADVILMNQGLEKLPEALGLGKHTFKTIQQNLFWAFAYNIVAIPIAMLGLLTPAFAAMAMGFSDVMLALISLRLLIIKLT